METLYILGILAVSAIGCSLNLRRMSMSGGYTVGPIMRMSFSEVPDLLLADASNTMRSLVVALLGL